MSITTLQERVFAAGPVSASFVETVDPNTKERLTNYEVNCEAIECVRYACTRLTEDQARVEVVEHAQNVHGWTPSLARAIAGIIQEIEATP